MSLNELEIQILYAFYKQRKNGNVQSSKLIEFCTKNGIKFNSENQIWNAYTHLKSLALLQFIQIDQSGDSFIQLTPDGLRIIEVALSTRKDLISSDVNGEDTSKDKKSNSEHSAFPFDVYIGQENYNEYKDSSVSPCFGVDQLAECYIQQLDKIAEHTNDNFCMLGIFGPWGRGKTYFFQRVKEIITKRQKIRNVKGYLLNFKNRIKGYYKNICKIDDEQISEEKVQGNNVKSSHIRYKIIEFNAWKYQDTPAIWAYLYETIYKQGFNVLRRRLFDFIYIFNHHWLQILSTVCCLGIIYYLYYIILSLEAAPEGIRNVMNALKIPLSFFTPISGILYTIIKNPFSLIESIEKKLKNKSYKGMLGVQNDLEQDLQLLIETIILRPKKKQIILYVDDIDRCDTFKMLNVVNALRLILENKEIQKSMIVICSIDVNKYIDAYCSIKYPQKEITDTYKSEAKLHLDKLFLFSIGLPSINSQQQIQYLHTLYEGNQNLETDTLTVEPPFRGWTGKDAFLSSTHIENPEQLTESKLGEFLEEYLSRTDIKGITPRKIRILFYRLTFARNIIAAGNGLITKRVMEQIINNSISNNLEDIDSNSAYSDVINMVVPY